MKNIRFFTLPGSDIIFFCSGGCLYINSEYLEWALSGTGLDALCAGRPAEESSAAD